MRKTNIDFGELYILETLEFIESWTNAIKNGSETPRKANKLGHLHHKGFIVGTCYYCFVLLPILSKHHILRNILVVVGPSESIIAEQDLAVAVRVVDFL